ncbi:hypothetical protein THRCLA_06949 [Thraustotheca clavata]|uniref:RING-type domain-containing protein n=1 Tax=Thraustotheca clavata TaxID=74557 RepID=A0A1V9ZHI5_9STRA|nr:hypothetical protein THRCLA_06949 [Thraustotheca clavata]
MLSPARTPPRLSRLRLLISPPHTSTLLVEEIEFQPLELTHFECQLCCETFEVEFLSERRHQQCLKSVCKVCLSAYINAKCSLKSLAALPCPICDIPIDLVDWKDILSYNSSAYELLITKISASCASFCPQCSGLLLTSIQPAPTSWWSKLSDKYEELSSECVDFNDGNRTAAELVDYVVNTFGPLTPDIFPTMYQWMTNSDRLFAFIMTRRRLVCAYNYRFVCCKYPSPLLHLHESAPAERTSRGRQFVASLKAQFSQKFAHNDA